MTTGEEADDDECRKTWSKRHPICGDITAAKDDIDAPWLALGRLSSTDYSGSGGTIEEPLKMTCR